ncbi:hypothetical protein [Alienimonas californiensis]|uniref:Uncharacterized protein n=1 Tax=Alienimonas californiensis TaxID=2527989 RepID=A0A517PBJ6_9PLAN|nr:hypothetical protein [Alienimonas californiensis]QDT16740.1 hypothetical protein CA12_28470 [Alienimonas californiensis]
MKPTTTTDMTPAGLQARADAFAMCAGTMAFRIRRDVFFDQATGLIAFADNNPDEGRPERLSALRERLSAEGVVERAVGGYADPEDDQPPYATPYTVVLLLDVPAEDGMSRRSGVWPVRDAVRATVGEIGLTHVG